MYSDRIVERLAARASAAFSVWARHSRKSAEANPGEYQHRPGRQQRDQQFGHGVKWNARDRRVSRRRRARARA
jgi:hypothetical protein